MVYDGCGWGVSVARVGLASPRDAHLKLTTRVPFALCHHGVRC